MLRETARRTGAFPEQENFNGLWSCHREKAIKASYEQPGTDADSPP